MIASVLSFLPTIVVALLPFFMILNIAASAQSGRPPVPSPTPPIKPAVTDIVAAEPACEKETEDQKYIHPTVMTDFIAEVNRLGTCGYRLEKADKLPFGPGERFDRLYAFAVVRRYHGDKFEYDWFEAMSPGELQTRINARAEIGFSLRKALLADRIACLGDASSGADGSGLVAAGGIFIVERKNGIAKKNDYRVLDGIVGDDKFMAENQRKLDDSIASGYRPVAINYGGYLTAFVVLVEKDPDIKPDGEYLLVRHVYGISKKFTKLSREGYAPMFVGLAFAVMSRTSSAPQDVSYFSFDVFPTFQKKLSRFPRAYLKAKGLSLQTCYTPESKLYFAELPEGSPMYEYKFLDMKNYRRMKTEGGGVDQSFAEAPTPEILAEFQQLLKDGYIIRDVLEWQSVYIIFERPKRNTVPW